MERTTLENDLLLALKAISGLWPEPPFCAEVNPEYIGPNNGKLRAILLETALDISRAAISKANKL